MLTAFARRSGRPTCARSCSFTLGIIALFRLGSHSRRPASRYGAVQKLRRQAVENNGLYGLINLFSGGALLQLSVFALGIMPYITASIILQLLIVVIPRLEALKKEGQAGQAKLTQYTRYLTVGARGAAVDRPRRHRPLARPPVPGLHRGPRARTSRSFVLLSMVLTMTAGTAVIMWLAELITDRGVGNGMSLLIFTSIIAPVPRSSSGRSSKTNGVLAFVAVIAIGVVIMVAAVVFVEQAQRRIPVQYAKRHGRPPAVRRHVDLHPDQGQHGRRHPGHLRLVAALHPARCSSACPADQTVGLAAWIQQQLRRAATTRSTC